MIKQLKKIIIKMQSALGNAEALYFLGYDYLFGIGTEPNLNLSHQYLSKAANKGFSRAKELLECAFEDKGKSCKLSKIFEDDYEAACRLCQAADKGDPASIYLLYSSSLSDDTDDYRFNRAISQMKLSADKNYPPALFQLGMTYLNGERIIGKKKEGLKMLTNAVEQEYVPAVEVFANLFPEKAFPIVSRIARNEDADPIILGLMSQYYMNGIVVDKDTKQGIKFLHKATEKGDKISAFNLGVIYEDGLYGEDKNIERAIAYYEIGIEREESHCMNNLGYILEHSEEYPQDHKRAFELYKRSANLGNSMGYNNMGLCYKRGIGTFVDAKKALECYELAIAAGDKDYAYWNIYVYYSDGVCLPPDLKKAKEWLQKGDEKGNLKCTYQLAQLLKSKEGLNSNADKYFSYLKKAADGGFKEAYNELANCYKYGVGTKTDYKSAFELYEKASHNDVAALNNLAQCYIYGIGTDRNLKKAFCAFKVAAEHGHAQSQLDLAICYRQGEGTEQDFDKAVEWYLKAIEQGNGKAMSNLGILYDNGIGVDKDPKKAFKYYAMSAKTGEKDGQFNLARMYFQGRGIEQNYEEAVKWFKAAAEQGEPDSMFCLAICYNEGYGVEKDPKLTKEYLFQAALRNWQPAIDVIIYNNLESETEASAKIDFNINRTPSTPF